MIFSTPSFKMCSLNIWHINYVQVTLGTYSVLKFIMAVDFPEYTQGNIVHQSPSESPLHLLCNEQRRHIFPAALTAASIRSSLCVLCSVRMVGISSTLILIPSVASRPKQLPFVNLLRWCSIWFWHYLYVCVHQVCRSLGCVCCCFGSMSYRCECCLQSAL